MFTVMLPLKIQVLVLNQNNIDLFETIDIACDTTLLLNYYQKIILWTCCNTEISIQKRHKKKGKFILY